MFTPIRLDADNPSALTGEGNLTYLVSDRGNWTGSTGAVLVDAGVGRPRHLEAIETALTDLNAVLTCVVVTHAHSDHAGGAKVIAERYPRARLHKYPWPEEDDRYGVRWGALADGEVIQIGDESLVVVHTPGHAPDHVAFWHEASGTVLTGDLVIAGSSVMIPASRGGDLVAYLASLERIQALAPTRLLPAHGPEIGNPAAVLTAYLRHRRMREQQVIAALSGGRDTVQAIAESIYHGLDPALMPAALDNVRAHLEKLRVEGRAAPEAPGAPVGADRARDLRWSLHG